MIAGALAALAAAAETARRIGPWGGALLVVAAFAFFAVGTRLPRIVALGGGAVAGALLGAGVPLAGRSILGAAAGGLVGAFVGFLGARELGVVLASSAAGLLGALALVAAFAGHPLGRELAAHPFALVAVALVLAIAGAAYQLSRPFAPPRRPTVPRPPGPPTLPDRGERGYP